MGEEQGWAFEAILNNYDFPLEVSFSNKKIELDYLQKAALIESITLKLYKLPI